MDDEASLYDGPPIPGPMTDEDLRRWCVDRMLGIRAVGASPLHVVEDAQVLFDYIRGNDRKAKP